MGAASHSRRGSSKRTDTSQSNLRCRLRSKTSLGGDVRDAGGTLRWLATAGRPHEVLRVHHSDPYPTLRHCHQLPRELEELQRPSNGDLSRDQQAAADEGRLPRDIIDRTYDTTTSSTYSSSLSLRLDPARAMSQPPFPQFQRVPTPPGMPKFGTREALACDYRRLSRSFSKQHAAAWTASASAPASAAASLAFAEDPVGEGDDEDGDSEGEESTGVNACVACVSVARKAWQCFTSLISDAIWSVSHYEPEPFDMPGPLRARGAIAVAPDGTLIRTFFPRRQSAHGTALATHPYHRAEMQVPAGSGLDSAGAGAVPPNPAAAGCPASEPRASPVGAIPMTDIAVDIMESSRGMFTAENSHLPAM